MKRLLGITILAPALLAAQTPVAELDTAVVRVGERMVLTLRMEAVPGVQWPVVADTLNRHVEVVRAGAVDTITADEVTTLRQRIAITSFDTGHWAIPPFRFQLGTTTVETKPLLVEVRAMPVDTTGTLRPIHGIIDPPVSAAWLLRHYGPWVAGVAVLAGLLVLLITYLRRRKPAVVQAPVAVEEPLHVRTLAALRAVEGEHLWQVGRHKEYHARITDLLRAYIEGRYQVPALERTTAELMQELSTSAMPLEQQRALHGMLSLADMVKFAKLNPAPTEHEAMLRNAIRLVESTIPPLSIAPDHAPRS